MIEFACPQCQKSLRAPEERAGAAVTCPGCRRPLQVPTPVAAAPPEPVEHDPFAGIDDDDSPPTEDYDAASALPGGFELPPEMQEEVEQLGRVVRAFGPNRGRNAVLLTLAAFMGPVGLLMLFGFFLVGWRMGCTGFVILAIAVVCLIAAWGAGAPLYRSWGQRVIVFQQGFAKVQGGRCQVYRWGSIATVFWHTWTQSNPSRAPGFRVRHNRLIISPKEGLELEFNDTLGDIKRLATLTMRAVEKAGGKAETLDLG